MGNNQDPTNWGPPTLNFSSGIAALMDAQSEFNRNSYGFAFQALPASIAGATTSPLAAICASSSTTISSNRTRGERSHSRAQPREVVANSATIGSDLADFLLGVPDASSIAFGNADKYLRQPVYDAVCIR